MNGLAEPYKCPAEFHVDQDIHAEALDMSRGPEIWAELEGCDGSGYATSLAEEN